MKNFNYKTRIYFIIVSIVFSFFIVGCDEKNITDPKDTPPELPPLSSFLIDFSDFTSSNAIPFSFSKIEPNDKILSRQHWNWAAANVAVWNILLTVGLAVPVASFVESFNHDPVLQSDGSWIWSYNFRIANILYTAELHAKFISTGVQWDMFISKQNFYTDFHWYSGKSNFLLTEGTWTLNNNPDAPSPLLGIVWHRDIQNNTADIKYTNIVPNGTENGGYIFYGTTTETPYDAFYDIYNKGQDNHTDIKWNRTTKEGRVNDPLHFSDSEWHCWDSSLEDTACQ